MAAMIRASSGLATPLATGSTPSFILGIMGAHDTLTPADLQGCEPGALGHRAQ